MPETVSLSEMFWLQPLWQQLSEQRQRGQLPQGLLISGARGMGKKTLACVLAQRLLCQQAGDNPEGCGVCKDCQLFKAGTHPDFHLVEPNDKGIINVDVVRAVTGHAWRTSHQGGSRVIVLNHAHGMNANAANALLKTLEEPPAGVYLVLISHAPQLLLPTIISRCQQPELQRPGNSEAINWLTQRGINASRAFVNASSLGPLALADAVAAGEQEVYKQLMGAWVNSLLQNAPEESLAALIAEHDGVAINWSQSLFHTLCRQPEKLQTEALKARLIALSPARRIAALHNICAEFTRLAELLSHSGINRPLQIQACVCRVITLLD